MITARDAPTRPPGRLRDERQSLDTEIRVPRLSQIKAHLNLTHDEDDVYLVELLGSAKEYLERVGGHYVDKQTRRVHFARVGRKYVIPSAPWQSLSAITVLDEGSETAKDTADYYVEEGPPAVVKPKSNTSIPSATSIRIEYVVGYTSEDDVPDGLRRALLTMVADMYEHRSSFPLDSGAEPTFSWDALIAPYKILTV